MWDGNNRIGMSWDWWGKVGVIRGGRPSLRETGGWEKGRLKGKGRVGDFCLDYSC